MKEQSTTKGFAMLSLAGIIAKIFSLIYVPALTRILGKEGMGIYFQVYDVFVFVYALLNIGMQTAVAKYVSELGAIGNHKDALRSFKISRTLLFLIGSLFTMFLIFSAPIISNMVHNKDITYGLMLIAPAILITSLLATYKGYFQGINQIKPVAIASVLEQIANVLFSLLFAAILIKISVPLGSAGGTLGTSLGALIALAYLIYVFYIFRLDKIAKESHNPSTSRVRTKRIIKTMGMYALPIMLSSGLQNFGNVIDMANVQSRLVYAGYTTTRANEMYGLLGQWRTLINIPLLFATSLGLVILPVISKANVLKDRATIKEKMSFSFRVTYLLSIPAAFGLATLSKEVYKYIYGSTDGYLMMVLGSIVVVLMSVVLIQNIILQGLSNFYYVIFTLIVGLVIKFITNYILVGNPKINIYGAIVGFILCFLISMLLNNRKLKKVLNIKINNIRLFAKPLLASIYMTVGIVLFKIIVYSFIDINTLNPLIGVLMLLFMVALGGVLYLHGIIILGAIKKDDVISLSPSLYNRIPSFISKKFK